MRLFIAAELPYELTEALAETSAALRGCVRGRYVAPDSFHVTLAFIGNVDAARVGQTEDALIRGCGVQGPFDVTLGELGFFGRRAKAALWQGFQEAGALPDLAVSIRDELRAYGFGIDAKTFVPHVTLMRAADLTAGELPMPMIARAQIEYVTLFSSDLSGEYPVYEPVYRVRLR